MKQKTHQALRKRLTFSSAGKISHKPAGINHLRVNKSPRTTALKEVSSVETKRIRKMLPHQ